MTPQAPFTFEEMNSVLRYEDGHLYWVKVIDTGMGSGRRRVGDDAVNVDARGYGFVIYRGKHIKAHRIVWLLCKGEWPMVQLDHRDGVKLNNRIENLRLATTSQNKANSAPYEGRAYKGITKQGRRWRAAIYWQGNNRHLGVFDTPEEAAAAYDAAAKEVHGEFARLNGA